MTVPAPAPALRGPVVFDQRWTDLVFLHWALDPSVVAPLLPAGTRPDTYDGVTYVGLVPFTMRAAGPGRDVPVPYLGRFHETNVRLYSVDDAGRQGVVFRSLDCERLAVTAFARFGLRLPYTWASMRTEHDGTLRRYRARRRWPRPAVTSDVTVRVGPRASATDLEHFLTRRWGLHSSWAGRTIWIPNQHPEWPLFEAEVVELRDASRAAAGVAVSGPPTLRALWSPGVQAQFGAPVTVAAPAVRVGRR